MRGWCQLLSSRLHRTLHGASKEVRSFLLLPFYFMSLLIPLSLLPTSMNSKRWVKWPSNLGESDAQLIHILNGGWQQWVPHGEVSGTFGLGSQSQSLLKVNLRGLPPNAPWPREIPKRPDNRCLLKGSTFHFLLCYILSEQEDGRLWGWDT